MRFLREIFRDVRGCGHPQPGVSPSMDVYVMKEGRRTGPFQPFRLREMLEDGTLVPGDAVWHEGMAEWKPLVETESLSIVLDKEKEPATTATEEPPERKPVPRTPLNSDQEATLALMRARRALAGRRFFARHIDMLLVGAATVGSATAWGLSDVWSLHLPDTIFILLAPALVWLLLEPLLLTLWGTTPGKALLGLRVEREEGGRPSVKQAYLRSVLVWGGGMGFGLRAEYLLPVAQWGYSWWMLQKRGTTLWDRTAGTVVRASRLQRRHALGLALAAAAYTALWFWLTLAAPLPDRLDTELREEIEQLRRKS
jgi:uncharacterized RDD family membrane protein YckC